MSRRSDASGVVLSVAGPDGRAQRVAFPAFPDAETERQRLATLFALPQGARVRGLLRRRDQELFPLERLTFAFEDPAAEFELSTSQGELPTPGRAPQSRARPRECVRSAGAGWVALVVGDRAGAARGGWVRARFAPHHT
jgi:hypothetical protein